MSQAIIVCRRGDGDDAALAAAADACLAHLTPSGLAPRRHLVRRSPGLVTAVSDPTPATTRAATGLCLGALMGSGDAWARPGAPLPDGSHVLARHDEHLLEFASDTLASRTLWYVHTPNHFLASSSQRALTWLLGSFAPEASAVTWMATSGTLGPRAGWDRRFARLPGGSLLALDRDRWQATLSTQPVAFVPEPRGDDEHVDRLRSAILASCEELDVDLDDWVLPLSGGMDSRALLYALLDRGRRPRCVTWGLRRSLDDPRNDAAVARRVAAAVNVEHRYFPTDHSGEPVADVRARFLAAGEGRTEDIAGYTDGMATWRALRDAGVAGVIRGDEPGWGYRSYHSESYARRRIHLTVLDDYPDSHLVRRLDLQPAALPDDLRRREDESLVTYRDRAYEAYNLPTLFAALNDVKAPYVEIANPFLTRRVVSVVRGLPDHLRERRVAFARVVGGLGPVLPYAERAAPAEPEAYLRRQEVTDELLLELGSGAAEQVLSRAALDRVVEALERPGTAEAHRRLRKLAQAVVPHEVGRRLRPNASILLSARQLALRLCIASRMTAMLRRDADLGRAHPASLHEPDPD